MKKTVLDINVRIEEIKKALTNKMYLSAISLALTVPDICGRIENTTCDAKEKYIQWVDKYVTPKYIPQPYIDDNDSFQQSEKRAFTGTRCYGLRCAVLHSGNEDLSRNHMDLEDESSIAPANKVYRIYLFDDPEHEIVYSTGSKTNESVEIDFYLNIHKFCESICEGAKKTIEQFGETDAIEKYSIEVLEYGRPL